MKFKKTLLLVLTLTILLFFISSVSAADFTVNSNTTHKDISDWMKSNTTVKGNSLVFNVSSYDLDDTIKVSKSVKIKSNTNTKINLKKNVNMFNVSSSEVSFSGMTLNHYGAGKSDLALGIIAANSSYNQINVNKMTFNLNNKQLIGIIAINLKGNITNSVFNGKGYNGIAAFAVSWTGNVYNSSVVLSGNSNAGFFALSKWTGNISKSKISIFGNDSMALTPLNWVGNIYNSNIFVSSKAKSSFAVFSTKWKGSLYKTSINMKGSLNYGIFVMSKWTGSSYDSKIYSSGKDSISILPLNWKGGLYSSLISASGIGSMGLGVNGTWTGKISKSKIYANAKKGYGLFIFSPKSKGTIEKSVVSAKNGYAIGIPKSIKVINTKSTAKKGIAKIYYFGPKLAVGSIQYSYSNIVSDVLGLGGSRAYIIEVYNYGEYSSKIANLVITGGGYKKTVKIKTIKSEKSREMTVYVPKWVSSSKITKYAKVVYYNGAGKKTSSKALKFI